MFAFDVQKTVHKLDKAFWANSTIQHYVKFTMNPYNISMFSIIEHQTSEIGFNILNREQLNGKVKKNIGYIINLQNQFTRLFKSNLFRKLSHRAPHAGKSLNWKAISIDFLWVLESLNYYPNLGFSVGK